mmetsp:Transcript_5469/g.9900  ORF Transcript_5469/g.9900 Transcript_5469/m.9900 type:complete len:195 (+) Transcript_5469:1758-2342(+)
MVSASVSCCARHEARIQNIHTAVARIYFFEEDITSLFFCFFFRARLRALCPFVATKERGERTATDREKKKEIERQQWALRKSDIRIFKTKKQKRNRLNEKDDREPSPDRIDSQPAFGQLKPFVNYHPPPKGRQTKQNKKFHKKSVSRTLRTTLDYTSNFDNRSCHSLSINSKSSSFSVTIVAPAALYRLQWVTR